MRTPKNYTATYEQMPTIVRRRILYHLKRWGGWTKTTAYRKMSGESLTPMEEVLLDGVFEAYKNRMSKQLEIIFLWDGEDMMPKVEAKEIDG